MFQQDIITADTDVITTFFQYICFLTDYPKDKMTRLLAPSKHGQKTIDNRTTKTVLEAQARALMKSTNMAFDDAFAHVIAEIGGDWDKWKSALGSRNREKKDSAIYKSKPEGYRRIGRVR